jgi:hypothetical protein
MISGKGEGNLWRMKERRRNEDQELGKEKTKYSTIEDQELGK